MTSNGTWVGITRFVMGIALWSCLSLSGASPMQAQQVMEGTIHAIWDVGITPERPDGVLWYLVAADGTAVEFTLSPALRQLYPAVDLLDRRTAVVGFSPPSTTGIAPAPGSPGVSMEAVSIQLQDQGALDPGMGIAPGALGPSSQRVAREPVLVLLCRFPDDPAIPTTRAERESIFGPSYPGMQDFFGEMAGDPSFLSPVAVTDWYTVPESESSYRNPSFGFGVDLPRLTQDCMDAADPDVYFPSFEIISMQFNSDFLWRPTAPYDLVSVGGSLRLSNDGIRKIYGLTWIQGSHAFNRALIAHELGHALGWPHSSGPYGNEYDSRWDLMSYLWVNDTPEYGFVGIHTIADHKRRVGWIREEEILRLYPGMTETAVITRSALPPPGSGYRMAMAIRVRGGLYTLEVRKFAGYDSHRPGEAVVIHEVIQGGRAYVVDPDNDGDPNDDGAMWLPGEVFEDPESRLRIEILDETPDGFLVRITQAAPLEIVVESELPGASLGQPYDTPLVAEGGDGRFLWSVEGGLASLPPGLRLSTDGLLSGIPEEEGEFTFTARVESASQMMERDFILTVSGPVVVTTEETLPAGAVGAEYAASLTATGGNGEYVWALSEGDLPSGIRLEEDGRLTGTPSDPGTYSFVVTVSSAGSVATREFRLDVKPAPLEILAESGLPTGTATHAYGTQLSASGGSEAHAWTLVDGLLPEGLDLSANGLLSGRPVEDGTFEFTLAVSSGDEAVEGVFTLSIEPPELDDEAIIDVLLGMDDHGLAVEWYLDNEGNENGRLDIGDVLLWLERDAGSGASPTPGREEVTQ